MSDKPKIYFFISRRMGSDFIVNALAEDGTWFGNHMSSSEYYAQHDIGYTDSKFSEYRRVKYDEHYPNGYEKVWVPMNEVDEHPGLSEAYRLNQLQKETDEKEKVAVQEATTGG